MTHADADYVVVGKIGTTYGIKGWLKIHSFTETVGSILDYPTWYLEEGNAGIGDSWKLVKVQDAKQHGKGIIAKLPGFENPEQARMLTGKKIAILRAQLPKLAKDEYYWDDLIGLTVIDQHGTTLGQVSFLLPTGANDVLVVKGTKEHAIPYLPGDVIKDINLEEGVMRVDWEII